MSDICINQYTTLAIRLKKLMDDIVKVAYDNAPENKKKRLCRFTICCSDMEQKTRLGYCKHLRDGSSEIHILHLKREGWKEVIITTIHEVSHHVDHVLRGTSNHDAEFYAVHKQLLFAAMDMGVLEKRDVVNSESHARNRDKLARMMSEYRPHPVNYKQDQASIYVYNSYDVKDVLRGRGYQWNSLDKAWTLDLSNSDLESEKEYLVGIGVATENIKAVCGGIVAVRLRKIVRLYNVPFDANAVVKSYNYRWAKEQKCWEKHIEENSISAEERKALQAFKGVRILIS